MMTNCISAYIVNSFFFTLSCINLSSLEVVVKDTRNVAQQTPQQIQHLQSQFSPKRYGGLHIVFLVLHCCKSAVFDFIVAFSVIFVPLEECA